MKQKRTKRIIAPPPRAAKRIEPTALDVLARTLDAFTQARCAWEWRRVGAYPDPAIGHFRQIELDARAVLKMASGAPRPPEAERVRAVPVALCEVLTEFVVMEMDRERLIARAERRARPRGRRVQARAEAAVRAACGLTVGDFRHYTRPAVRRRFDLLFALLEPRR
jgi:hypothetical protein